MRMLVEPAPSSRCKHCGGELRLQRVEPENLILDLVNEIFQCARCGREAHYVVRHDHHLPHYKVA